MNDNGNGNGHSNANDHANGANGVPVLVPFDRAHLGRTSRRAVGPKRIGFVFGTRPEAIKLAPVIAACRDLPGLEPVVCVTAQHRDLLDQVLGLFDIEPDEDLNLMTEGQTLAGFASKALDAVGAWLESQRLD